MDPGTTVTRTRSRHRVLTTQIVEFPGLRGDTSWEREVLVCVFFFCSFSFLCTTVVSLSYLEVIDSGFLYLYIFNEYFLKFYC